MNLRSFKSRLRQIVVWASRGRFHLLSIASFLITVLYLTRYLRFYPSGVALFMTLAGLFIILTQQVIDATQFDAHKPNTLIGWLKSFPTGKPTTISVEGAACVIVGGKAHMTVSIAADSTIERKVDFLLRQITAHDSAIAKLDDRVDEVNSSLKKTAGELQASVNTINTSLNRAIASHVVGSYDLNMFGINITIF